MTFSYIKSLVGKDHLEEGRPNEDSCFLASTPQGIHVAVCADGMGGSVRGGQAAELVVDRVSKLICSSLLTTSPSAIDEYAGAVLKASFAAGANALGDTAAKLGCCQSDLGTTLMGCVFDQRTHVLHYGYCGDGGILAFLEDGTVTVAAQPQKGEDHCQTYSALDFDMWEFGTINETIGFAVATDGVFDALSAIDRESNLITANETAFLIFDLILRQPEEATDCLDGMLASSAEGPFAWVGDDRTFAIAVDVDANISSLRLNRKLLAGSHELTPRIDNPNLRPPCRKSSTLMDALKAKLFRRPSKKVGKHAAHK